MSFIQNHPGDAAGYVGLYSCANKWTLPDLIRFFNAIPPQAPSMARLLLANLYQIDREPVVAENVNNGIIAAYPNTPLEVKAEINNMLIDLYDKNDIRGAEALLANIKAQASLTTPMELWDAEEAVALHGGVSLDGVRDANTGSGIPKSSSLLQNYPNPFNPTTVISYRLKTAGHVMLRVYDVLGREVMTLVDAQQAAGPHSAQFNGQNLTSGVYLYRLTAPGIDQVKKMLMIK